MRHKYILFLVLAAAISGPVLAASDADKDKGPKIKKCKDAAGKWHYGDSAAEECAQSKVTVISEKGFTRKVIAAPLTEAELKERELKKEELEKEQKNTEDQAKRDALLLSTYGVEDDINYVRDRKIAQIESSIRASEETLKSLRGALARMEAQAKDEATKGDKAATEQTAKNIEQTKHQIGKHEAVVAAKKKEQEDIRNQYAADLARYRELKKGGISKPVPAKAQTQAR
ncbi:MAG: hypothetical protein AAB134_05185 [Pseudomonadota bacterium]